MFLCLKFVDPLSDNPQFPHLGQMVRVSGDMGEDGVPTLFNQILASIMTGKGVRNEPKLPLS